MGLKITTQPGPRVFKPKPDATQHTSMNLRVRFRFVGPPDALRALHIIELMLSPSPQSPSMIVMLLPAYLLYYTFPVKSLHLWLLLYMPAAAVFTFNLLLLEHCCLRGHGGYSSPSSEYVCDFHTFCSIYSEILQCLSIQLLCIPFFSL